MGGQSRYCSPLECTGKEGSSQEGKRAEIPIEGLIFYKICLLVALQISLHVFPGGGPAKPHVLIYSRLQARPREDSRGTSTTCRTEALRCRGTRSASLRPAGRIFHGLPASREANPPAGSALLRFPSARGAGEEEGEGGSGCWGRRRSPPLFRASSDTVSMTTAVGTGRAALGQSSFQGNPLPAAGC